MKICVKAIFILLILLSSISFGQEKRYRLIIRSDPTGAKVFLNDKYRKDTPCGFSAGENFKVKISIQKEGYQVWSKTYVVKDDIIINQHLIKTSNLMNSSEQGQYPLKLYSKPPDADVYINGEFSGKTPCTVSVTAGEELEVVVNKKNYQEWAQTFSINEQTRKTIKLIKISKSKNKTWMYAGAAIAGGGLIAYLATKSSNSNGSGNNWPQPPGRPN